MLTLPSTWSLILSLLVFFIAAGYLRRYLDEQDIPKGMTRATLIFTFAFLLAWGTEKAADWAQETMEGPTPAVQLVPDTEQAPKEDELPKP